MEFFFCWYFSNETKMEKIPEKEIDIPLIENKLSNIIQNDK